MCGNQFSDFCSIRKYTLAYTQVAYFTDSCSYNRVGYFDKSMSISLSKVAFLISRDFVISSNSCGDVGEIKKNEGKSFYFNPN